MSKLTREQINEAVDTLGKWFPEEAPNLEKYREAIVDHVVGGTELVSDSPLASVKFGNLTECEEACGMVAADVVSFVFGLAGLHVSNEERIRRAIIQELGWETLRGLSRMIHEFNEASGATKKAWVLFRLMCQIWKAGGFGAALKIIKSEMPWWEWVKTGLLAVTQITAWIASDGVAFVAEAVLSIMSAEQLIEDAVHAVKVCNCK